MHKQRIIPFFLFLATLAILTACGSGAQEKHIGSWHNLNSSSDSTIITLDEEGYYHLSIGGVQLLGKELLLHGSETPSSAHYVIDYTTTPFSFDLLEKSGGKETSLGIGIVDFPDENTMRLKMNSSMQGDPRPTAIVEGDPKVSVLKRVQ